MKRKYRNLTDTYNLAVTHPEIASQWHPTKNELSPREVTPCLTLSVWWICDHGHEWQAKIYHRTRTKTGCRLCKIGKVSKDYNLFVSAPDLMKEWCYELNADLNPEHLSLQSGKYAWWECQLCKHRWTAPIQHRTSGRGCPSCKKEVLRRKFKGKGIKPRRLLMEEFPELIEEWHRIKNQHINLNEITSGSSKIKVWWICSTCKHEWSSTVVSRTIRKSGCPKCKKFKVNPSNNLKVLYPSLVVEWDYVRNGELQPEKVAPKSDKKVWWICKRCNHSWQTRIRNRTVEKSGCPVCN